MVTENLPEKDTLNKHFYDCAKINVAYDKIKDQVKSIPAQELSEDFLNKHLLNSNFKSLTHLDFLKFDKLLKERRQFELITWSQDEFLKYKKAILSGITNNILPPPIIIQDMLGKYFLFSGEARMLAYKVLGIAPVVKIVHLDCVLSAV